MTDTTAVAANGVRFAERRVGAHGRIDVVNSDGALCFVTIAGVGELHERTGSYLLRAGMIAVRPGRYRGGISAGPDGIRIVSLEYPPPVLRQLGAIALGLSATRTFLGRSSVEFAWRAPAEIEGGDEFTPEALRLFSEGIAIGLSRFARHNRGHPSPLALRARKRLDADLAGAPDIAGLAKGLGCSAAYLSRLFHKSFGFSPTGYVMRRRCERARLLLTRDDTPVAQLATALGFHDASHFARHFRRQCGTSPQRFRQLHRQVESVPE